MFYNRCANGFTEPQSGVLTSGSAAFQRFERGALHRFNPTEGCYENRLALSLSCIRAE
jgi:hypothetical protein